MLKIHVERKLTFFISFTDRSWYGVKSNFPPHARSRITEVMLSLLATSSPIVYGTTYRPIRCRYFTVSDLLHYYWTAHNGNSIQRVKREYVRWYVVTICVLFNALCSLYGSMLNPCFPFKAAFLLAGRRMRNQTVDLIFDSNLFIWSWFFAKWSKEWRVSITCVYIHLDIHRNN